MQGGHVDFFAEGTLLPHDFEEAEQAFVEAEQAFWGSDECAEKLERGMVTRSCLERWAGLEFPTDRVIDPRMRASLRQSRHFYLSLLQRGDPKTFHDSFAKACCLLSMAASALADAGSPLLDDAALVTALCLGLARKEETQADTCEYVLCLCKLFEQQAGLPVAKRSAKQLKFAEVDLLEVMDWNLPQTDTYKCISAILLRTDILTRGMYKPQLELVWQGAVTKCFHAVLAGTATGYASAHALVADGLAEAGFPAEYLEHLLAEAAPAPKA